MGKDGRRDLNSVSRTDASREERLLVRLDHALAHALRHPIRRDILRHLSMRPEGGRATDLVLAVRGVSLSSVVYHARVLEQNGAATVTPPGGIETVPIYASAVSGNPAVDEVLRVTEGRDNNFGAGRASGG